MRSELSTQQLATRLVRTRIPDSWAWMWPDALIRLLPFTVALGLAVAASHRGAWLGLALGDVRAQLGFAAVFIPLMFVSAVFVQLQLTRRRGALSIPAGPGDAWFQAAFYVVNGPIEEGFFRGLVQGGLTVLWAAPAGFAIATAIYVLYHRLGRWTWPETLATALVGVPVGLAFWLLPGPPSLLGVSLAHVAATCGFLGPGPYLLKRLNLV